jgi:hypothetical protein
LDRHPALAFLLEHDLVGKPASTPDQVRGRLFPDYALVRHTFEAAARHRIARNKVEGVGDLEASLGMVAILIADLVA